jgi:hypothetical protein
VPPASIDPRHGSGKSTAAAEGLAQAEPKTG